MSNVPALPNELPKHLALYANDLQQFIDEACGGISSGMPPTIVAYGGNFTKKENGAETTIVLPETINGQPNPYAGQPASQLRVVVLRAKETLDKAWYATAFTPGQEPAAPDCFSNDGVRPDPSSPSPQCTACAGCPQNMFNSGKDAAGNPSKGKACADRKRLAIFAENSAWRFVVPPASLGTWVAYVKQLKAYGLTPQFVITTIGFDPQDKYKLTFNYGGVLGEAQVAKIMELAKSPEVLDIISSKETATPPAQSPETEKPAVADLAAEKKKKDDEKKAAAKAKKDADEKAKAEAAAAAATDDLGLGLDTSPSLEGEVVGSDDGPAEGLPSEDDLIAELGL